MDLEPSGWWDGLSKAWKPIHTWATGTTLGGLVTVLFWKRMADFSSGAWSKAGEVVFTYVLNRRKKSRRKQEVAKVIQIAKLQQKVADQGGTIRFLGRKVDKMDKKLVTCEARRNECMADQRNLLRRVIVLEKKIS